MKDRGKARETFNGDASILNDFSAPSDLPCRKHPSSSSGGGGGICAFCLRDRLMELVCPECGEQRLSSSCSCSENSSDPNSNPEIGGGARISFLIENEKSDLSKITKTGEPDPLKRSNSSTCTAADPNNRGGFWRIGRLFRKRRQKGAAIDDSKSEMWVSDIVGVPRSRSLCSFRGGVGGGNGGVSFYYDTEESGGMSHSAARVSSVSGGFMMDSAKRSCFSESEARISNFDGRISNFDGRISNFDYERDMVAKGFFAMREGCEFSCSDDPKFIDLKLDLSSSSSDGLKRGKELGFGSMRGGDLMRSNEYYGVFKNGGGSCRFSVSERDLKKCRKSRKVWRWFFRASSKLG